MHGAAPPIAEVAQYCRVPHRRSLATPTGTNTAYRAVRTVQSSFQLSLLKLYGCSCIIRPYVLLSSKLDGSIAFLSAHLNMSFFFSQLFSFLDVADDADQTLFNSMLKNNNVSQVILPEVKTSSLSIYYRKVTCYGV